MSEEQHDQIQELLGVYALNAVEQDERALVERHLETCDECRQEVAQHRSVATLLATTPEPVPTDLWRRVEEELDSTPEPETGSQAEGGSTVVPFRRRSWVPTVAAAAVAAVLAGVVAIQTNRIDQLDTDLAATQAQVARLEGQLASGDLDPVAQLASSSPEAMVLTLEGDGGSGTVVLLPDGTGFLADHTLQPVDPSEQTYQLWTVQAGEVISAGILGADPGVVAFHVDPATLEGLVITQEEAGGVPVSSQPATAAWFPEA